MHNNVTNEAIIFIEDNHVIKEMLYPEFVAILDHVVAVDEFSNQKSTGVYLRVDASLHITATVFFTLDFNANGFADSSWNIPLQHLADTAGYGADLGAGPIKLSCRSQCSVSWHQRTLWDPDLEPGGGNTLSVLVHGISRNRLGFNENASLIVEEIKSKKKSKVINNTISATKGKLKKEYQNQCKVLQQEQKRRLEKLKLDAQSQIESLQRLYREKLQKQSQELDLTKQLFLEEKHKNIQFKQAQEKHVLDLQQARQLFQQEINNKKGAEKQQIKVLEKKFQLEMNANIESIKSGFQENLDMREMELFYRDEQVKRLKDDVYQLKNEKQSFLNGGDQLLSTLAEKGISLLAYQPGMKEITIPLVDISIYIESPIKYMVNKLSLDEKQYRQWLAHYQIPICTYLCDNGEQCDQTVPKVENPSRFITGENDRCVTHSRAASALTELLKVREKSA